MRRALLLTVLTVLLVGCGGAAGGEPAGPTYTQEQIDQGQALYGQTCTTCHGPDARGLPNLGKDLVTSEFVAEMTDQELLEYVNEGRPADHPDNTTGVAMPPKGGFDFLTDEDILAIIAYLRSLQG